MRLDYETKAALRKFFGKSKNVAADFITRIEALDFARVNAHLEDDLMKNERQGVYSIKLNKEDRIIVLRNIGQGPNNTDTEFFRQTKHSGADKEYSKALAEANRKFQSLKGIYEPQATFEPQNIQQLAALAKQQSTPQQLQLDANEVRALTGYRQNLSSLYQELGVLNQYAPEFSQEDIQRDAGRIIDTYFSPEQGGKETLAAYQKILASQELSKDFKDPQLRSMMSSLVSYAQKNPGNQVGLQQLVLSTLPANQTTNTAQTPEKQGQVDLFTLAKEKLGLKR